MHKKSIILFFFLMFCISILGQELEKYRLQIINIENSNPEKYKIKKKVYSGIDSAQVSLILKDIKSDLIHQGYLSASIDSLTKEENNYFAYVYIGSLYIWKGLSFENIEEEVINSTRIKEKHFVNQPMFYHKLDNVRQELIKYYEQRGYPFTQVDIDCLLIEKNYFEGIIKLNKNQKFFIDTIFLKGKVNISHKLIYKYIGIQPGDLFNQKKIDQLDENINKLPFLGTAKPIELEFFEKKADLYIYLKKKKSNLFNGIIGFTSNENKLSLTGNVTFDLNNSFGIGEHIDFRWENYKDSSQFLSSHIDFPYLFFLPLGFEASFLLDKEQLDYLNVNYSFAFSYDLKPGNSAKVYFKQNRSFIIGDDADNIQQFGNVNYYSFGLNIGVDKTDRSILPMKGFSIQISSGYGNRWVSEEGNTSILELGLWADYNWYIANNISISLKNWTEGKFNETGFYENEFYKLGGIKSVRGFDEKSLLVSAFSLFTVEPRLFIGEYSYISIFSDFIYLDAQAIDGHNNSWAIGFGTGVSIDTKAGIFSLNFAIGKLENTPLQISNTKIHFGYAVRF